MSISKCGTVLHVGLQDWININFCLHVNVFVFIPPYMHSTQYTVHTYNTV